MPMRSAIRMFAGLRRGRTRYAVVLQPVPYGEAGFVKEPERQVSAPSQHPARGEPDPLAEERGLTARW